MLFCGSWGVVILSSCGVSYACCSNMTSCITAVNSQLCALADISLSSNIFRQFSTVFRSAVTFCGCGSLVYLSLLSLL